MFIVQLYCTYSLYYLVLHCSSDLCAAYLDYSATLTQPTYLVAATASHHPPPLNCQWWRSRSGGPLSIVNPPALPCSYQVKPNDQSCQACPYKTFSNQYANCCEPVQYFSKPTSTTIHTSRSNVGTPNPPLLIPLTCSLHPCLHCNATYIPVLFSKPISTK